MAVRRGVLIAEQTADDLNMIPVHADSYQQMQAMLDWGRVDLALVSSIEGISPAKQALGPSLHPPGTGHPLHPLPLPSSPPRQAGRTAGERSGATGSQWEKAGIADRLQKTFNVADTRSEKDSARE